MSTRQRTRAWCHRPFRHQALGVLRPPSDPCTQCCPNVLPALISALECRRVHHFLSLRVQVIEKPIWGPFCMKFCMKFCMLLQQVDVACSEASGCSLTEKRATAGSSATWHASMPVPCNVLNTFRESMEHQRSLERSLYLEHQTLQTLKVSSHH